MIATRFLSRDTRSIKIFDRPGKFTGLLDGRNEEDLYSFKFDRRQSFNLTLSGLQSNVDVALISNEGQTIRSSNLRGARSETISTTLRSGTYFIRIFRRRGKTDYTLKVAKNNDAPKLARTSSLLLGLRPGEKVIFDPDNGFGGVKDTLQAPDQLKFTLTKLPTNGTLQLNGKSLGLGSTFTQADINERRVSYSHLKDEPGRGQIFYSKPNGDIISLASKASYLHGSGSNLVWSAFDGNDYEVFLFNGTATSQLTNNTTDDFAEGISDSNVTWFSEVTPPIGGLPGPVITPGTYNFFYYNATTGTTTQLNPTPEPRSASSIDGSRVVWSRSVGSIDSSGATTTEIFLFDGNTTTQLTNNAANDNVLGISGANVIWTSEVGSTDSSGRATTELFFSNGITTTRLTNNAFNEWDAKISGSRVAWTEIIGSNSSVGFPSNEIFLFDGTTTKRLTNNAVYEQIYDISDSHIVWVSEGKIFLSNDQTITQLTNTGATGNNPQISGINTVWVDSYSNGFFDNAFKYNSNTAKTTKLLNQELVDPWSLILTDSLLAWVAPADRDSFQFKVTDGAGGILDAVKVGISISYPVP